MKPKPNGARLRNRADFASGGADTKLSEPRLRKKCGAAAAGRAAKNQPPRRIRDDVQLCFCKKKSMVLSCVNYT